MRNDYKTFGTLALAPVEDETRCDVIPFERHADDEPWGKSDVERTLDDFEGEPLARTASERRFAAAALAVAGFALFFLSFAPIF